MSADFKPTLDGYKDLKPFVFWAQTTLPTVFDDSLSYYEVLTKLTKMVNTLLENTDTAEHNIEALATVFGQLQDYVNHYFDSLDVSAEVNQRLDEMVEDGTLDAIILPIVEHYTSEVIDDVVHEQLSAVVAEQIGGAVAEQIDAAIAPQITPKVNAYLDTNLPPLVEEQVPVAVGEQIDPAVAVLLPSVVDEQLPNAVSTEMTTALPPVVQSQLPGVVATQIPGAVSSQMPAVLAPIATQQINTLVPNWLATHIHNPSSPPLDDTLGLKNCAAESWYVGRRFFDLQGSPATMVEDKKVVYQTGEVVEAEHWLTFTATVSDKFPVSVGYPHFDLTQDPIVDWTYAYYDANGDYIADSGNTWEGFINWSVVTEPVPDGAATIKFSIQSDASDFVSGDLAVLVFANGAQIIDAINDVDVSIVIDDTLTQPDMAADAKVTGDRIGALDAECDNLKCASDAMKDEQVISIPVTVTNGKSVLYKTGNLLDSGIFGYTDYIDVRLYESVTLKRLNLTATSVTAGIAFYDKDKNYLWGLPCIKGQAAISYFDDTIALTDDIAYVRCTTHSDTTTYGEFTITGKSKNIEMLYGYKFEPFCPFVAVRSINPNSGEEGASSSSSYYCHTDYVDCHGFDFVRYTRIMATGSDPVHGMAFYDENKNFITGSGQPYGANASAVHAEVNDFRIPTNAYYARFSYYLYSYMINYSLPDFSLSLIKVENLNNRIGRIDGEAPAIEGLYPYKPQSKGVENAIKRAHALARLKWTPVGEVTRQIKPIGGSVSVSKFIPGITYTGSPYSVTYQRNRNIGIDVSIHTFESVVSNPGTRIYDPSLNTRYAYFGNVCSSFVAYAVGMMAAPLTEVMAQYDGMQFIAPSGTWNETSVELGSILLKPDDHVVIVTGILTDANGIVQFVEITEATLNGYIQSGKVISKWYTPAKLMDRFAAYGLYWYSHIDDCEYRQSNFAQVYPEPESTENAKFMCVSAFGDGAVFGSNNTPAEVLIDSTAYTTGYRYLHVYRNGSLQNTYDIAADTAVVNVPKSETGNYYLVLDDGNGMISKPTHWKVYRNNFSKSISGTTLTLTYDTDATVFAISYITGTDPNDVELFQPCDVTGTGTIQFTVPEDARGVNVIFGDNNGALHKSI